MNVVVDIETTGTNLAEDKIREIGAIVLDGPRKGDVFFAQMDIPAQFSRSVGAARVNGGHVLSPVESHPEMAGTVLDFLEWLDYHNNYRVNFAGINPFFDRDFIVRDLELRDIRLDRFINHQLLDLGSFVAAISPGRQPLSSRQIYEQLSLPDEPKPHNALIGALWEYMAFEEVAASTSGFPASPKTCHDDLRGELMSEFAETLGRDSDPMEIARMVVATLDKMLKP